MAALAIFGSVGEIKWMAVLYMSEVTLPLLCDINLFAVQKSCHWDKRRDLCSTFVQCSKYIYKTDKAFHI